LVVIGPMTRTVADAAALLDVMAGPAPGDLWWAPPPARPFAEEVGQDPGRLRVALSVDAEGIPVDPAHVVAARQAAELLASLGHEAVEEAPPPVAAEVMPMLQASFSGNYVARELDGNLPPLETLTPWSQTLLEMGRGISAGELARAQRGVQTACRQLATFYERFDALVTPTVAAPAPPVGKF